MNFYTSAPTAILDLITDYKNQLESFDKQQCIAAAQNHLECQTQIMCLFVHIRHFTPRHKKTGVFSYNEGYCCSQFSGWTDPPLKDERIRKMLKFVLQIRAIEGNEHLKQWLPV